jgi:hypothetical protein
VTCSHVSLVIFSRCTRWLRGKKSRRCVGGVGHGKYLHAYYMRDVLEVVTKMHALHVLSPTMQQTLYKKFSLFFCSSTPPSRHFLTFLHGTCFHLVCIQTAPR